MEGALKIAKNHMCLCIVLGAGRRGGHSFPHLKEGLIPEVIKNPGVDTLWSLSPPSLDWVFPAHNISLTPSWSPISQSVDVRGEEQGRGSRCFGLLGEMHEDPWGSTGPTRAVWEISSHVI